MTETAAAPMRIEGSVGSADALGEAAVEGSAGETSVLRTRDIVLATGSVPRLLPGVPFDRTIILSTTEGCPCPECRDAWA